MSGAQRQQLVLLKQQRYHYAVSVLCEPQGPQVGHNEDISLLQNLRNNVQAEFYRPCSLRTLNALQGAYVIVRSDNHPVAGELRGQLSPAIFKLTSSSSSS